MMVRPLSNSGSEFFGYQRLVRTILALIKPPHCVHVGTLELCFGDTKQTFIITALHSLSSSETYSAVAFYEQTL